MRTLFSIQLILHGVLEDVPLHAHQNMWFQHKGTTPHISLAVWGHLGQWFGQKGVCRGGQIAWPAYSPNLTARLLPVGPQEELNVQDPCGIIGRPADTGYACGGFWTTRYWYHVYQNAVCRYCVCVEITGCHIEPFFYVHPEEKQCTVSSRIGRVQHVMCGILFVAGKRCVSGHEFLC